MLPLLTLSIKNLTRFAISSISQPAKNDTRYAVIQILVSTLIGARRAIKPRDGFFARFQCSRVHAICPPSQLQRLLDGLTLCVLSKNFPSEEKQWVLTKMNEFFESLHADYSTSSRSSTEAHTDLGTNIEQVLPPFPAVIEDVELGPNAIGTSLLFNTK